MLALLATAAGKVLAISLLVGAGLPALFALGVRSMASGAGRAAETAETDRPPGHSAGKVLGIALFAVVLFFVGTGIAIVVASGLGQSVSFEHLYPTFVPKGSRA